MFKTDPLDPTEHTLWMELALASFGSERLEEWVDAFPGSFRNRQPAFWASPCPRVKLALASPGFGVLGWDAQESVNCS